MAGTIVKAENILLECEEGQRLLDEAAARQDILMEMFGHQQHFSHCGMQSCALILAAFKCGQTCQIATRDDVMTNEHCKDIRAQHHGFAMFSFQETTDLITHDIIQTRGLTLDDVGQLLKNHRHKVEVCCATDSSVDEFRQAAHDALRRNDSSRGVIVNFQPYALGQADESNQYGHHSPLCAYHETTDMFLLLETEVLKPKLWFKTDDLFKAMLDVDVATKRSRGYVIMDGIC